jgi:hypothetical protein
MGISGLNPKVQRRESFQMWLLQEQFLGKPATAKPLNGALGGTDASQSVSLTVGQPVIQRVPAETAGDGLQGLEPRGPHHFISTG